MALSHELIERILLLLDINSMLKCRLVNREFNEIIQSSILLQYALACKAAGVVDNPRSPLSYAERLDALKKHEDAWKKLKPGFEMTINLNQIITSGSRSTGGVLFTKDNNEKDLNYWRAPSSPQDDLHRIRIPGHGPALDWAGILVNFATAIDEHDLVVNFISSETGNQADMQRHSLDFVFLKLSTGEYHPLARQPRIHVHTSAEVRPGLVSRIVGDNLALVVMSDDEIFPSKLFIFDWKTGHKRLQHEVTGTAYWSLVFVSPEFLLVPNCQLFHNEVWHIPNQPDLKPIQILSLQMPTISPGYAISYFRCHGEPSSFLHPTPNSPHRSFYPSPEDSVIMSAFDLSSAYRPSTSYHFIMDRRALLDTIQKWMFSSLLEEPEHQWLTNEVTALNTDDFEDAPVRSCAQSKPISRDLHSSEYPRNCDSTTFGTHQNSPSFDSGSSNSRYNFLQVPWAEWGPPISRWFPVHSDQARWMPLSNGQRYAFSEFDPHDRTKLIVAVADFNPHNVRKNAEMMAQHQSDGGDEKGKVEHDDKELEVLDHRGAFSEEVYMGLKCVVHRAPDVYDFDLVFMDEERLFGVKLNHWGWERSIKVLYIG